VAVKLVQSRCNVESKEENGQTALHLAAQGNKVEIVKLLLNTGKANANALDKVCALTLVGQLFPTDRP